MTAFEPVRLSGADSVGRLYFDGNRYLRGINSDAEGSIRDLCDSDLLRQLFDRGLVPSTRVVVEGVPDQLSAFPLVIEHEALTPITYPREWSFEMLKAAALAFLDLIAISLAHGYICKDAHPHNFVFRGTTPVWVDIGSFSRLAEHDSPLVWRREFASAILDPLRLWNDGCEFLARRSISHPALALPLDEYIAYRFPLLRGHSPLLLNLRIIFGQLRHPESVKRNSKIARIIKFISRRQPGLVISGLKRTIQKLCSNRRSFWGEYHRSYHGKGGEAEPTPRFSRIVDLVGQFNPRVITELAGNAGILSELLARQHPDKLIICTDYDASAIDILFRRAIKFNLGNLVPAVLDFMVPEYSTAETPPQQRLMGDCVVALAVTHHLLLSQGYGYDDVFSSIARYTRRFALIEFMPLGLHDGNGAPLLPDWYALDSFKAAFQRYFRCLNIEQLEENRILFVGELAMCAEMTDGTSYSGESHD